MSKSCKPGFDGSSRQLPLELPLTPRFGREDFLVSPCNEQAWQVVESWPEWPGNIMVLCGPEGSGKTHLGAIWAQRSGATTVQAAKLTMEHAAALGSATGILLEDAGPGALAQRETFHLINSLRETSGSLLITARRPPAVWAVEIPDLLSRLRLAPLVHIASPDDDLVRAVLVKLFHDRQLNIDTSVIEFLAVRIERSLAAARAIVEMLDQEALSRGRAITRPMAAEILRELEQDRLPF